MYGAEYNHTYFADLGQWPELPFQRPDKCINPICRVYGFTNRAIRIMMDDIA